MSKYHITYFYLATGMEGQADTKDYGFVEANSAKEAIDIICHREYPNNKDNREFLKGCLSASPNDLYKVTKNKTSSQKQKFNKRTIYSTNGTNLHFEISDKDLYDQYIKEEEMLLVKYYKLLRNRHGIYAGNQDKYVSSIDQLNDWDGKTMEKLAAKYED